MRDTSVACHKRELDVEQKPYDLIVVGTGTAGLILASRIAQHGVNPKSGEPLRIASIEAGPYWKGPQRPTTETTFSMSGLKTATTTS